MAFPFTPLTTYIANAVPKIKALDLNQIQAYIGHIFSATKTIKSLECDAVGNNASAITAGMAKALYLALVPAAGDANTIATITAAVTNNRLLFDIAIGTVTLRFYVTGTGALLITANAKWDAGAADWYSDNNAISSARMGFYRLAWSIKYHVAGAAHWAEGAWTDQASIDCVTAALTTLGVITGAHLVGNSATPGKVAGNGQGVPNVNANVTVAGNDAAGKITVVSSAGAIAGTVCTLTFASAYAAAPHVVIAPGNATAADLATQPLVTSTVNDLSLVTSGAPLNAAGATYIWYYHAIG